MANLPNNIEEKIFYDAENLYNKLDELAREQDHYEFGLPMFNKEKQPIIDLLTESANRAQKLADALESILNSITPANDNEAWIWIDVARRVAGDALSEYNQSKGGGRV